MGRHLERKAEQVIYKAETETGSIYVIDTGAKTWRKERMPIVENPFFSLRSQSGFYTEISDIKIGSSIVMTGRPLDKRATFRMITTSFVTKLETADE